MNRRHVAWSAFAVCVAAALISVSAAAFVAASKATEIRNVQQTNTATLDNTSRTLSLIESCTTPGRKCFDRGQRQTAKAVGDINRVAVYAAACADKPRRQTVAVIQACVIDRLAREHP